MRTAPPPAGAAVAPAGGGRFARIARLLRHPPPWLRDGLFALAVFLVALAALLPHDLLVRRAIDAATAGGGIAVSFDGVSFAFPNGYRFANLRVAPGRPPEAPAVTVRDLVVRTPLARLLLGKPDRARIAGNLWEGDLSADVARNAGTTSARVELRDADLARAAAALAPAPTRLAGRADLDVDLSGDGRTIASASGSARLVARRLEIHDLVVRGFAVPDLAFPEVALDAEVRGGRLQVKQFRAAGEALTVEASGDVLLREPAPQSVLNLKVTIEPGPLAPQAIRIATGLLPRRPTGEKPVYSVTGTLAAPQLR